MRDLMPTHGLTSQQAWEYFLISAVVSPHLDRQLGWLDTITETVLPKNLLPYYSCLLEGHPSLAASIATQDHCVQGRCRGVLSHHVPLRREQRSGTWAHNVMSSASWHLSNRCLSFWLTPECSKQEVTTLLLK